MGGLKKKYTSSGASKTDSNGMIEYVQEGMQENVGPNGSYKFLTHRADNGISSRDEDGEKLDEIYYVGIIDILQQFTIKKGLENFFKGFKYRRTEISATSPYFYSSRFVRFISKFTK